MITDYRTQLARVRAKSGRHGGEGESLLDHTAAVVSRLGAFHRLFPNLADRVRDPRLWHRAFWACVLHDVGKIAVGFQAQLVDGAPSWGHRHEMLSLAFLAWALPDDRHGDRAWVAAAVASHHRDVAAIMTLYPPPDGSEGDPVEAIVAQVDDAVVEALAVWLTEEPARWARDLAVPAVDVAPAPPAAPTEDFRRHGAERIHRELHAYRCLVRELAEQDAASPPNLAAIALRGLVLLCDHTASAHAPPPRVALTTVADTVASLGRGPLEDLYPHQHRAARTGGDLFLTAPTGSGKTEAAILWAARQQEDRIGRLFYLLPYQASLNAMKERLEKLFPGCVGLQHARALQALYRRLLDRSYDPKEAAAVARREHALASLHHQPVRVLTPYQLLRGAFRLRGYEALITDAADGVFVFDEIHAYEPARLGMILGLVDYLRESLGGRFLVMSATFPGVLREALMAVIGEATAVDAGRDVYRAFARHRIRLMDGWLGEGAVMAAVDRRIKAGESVLLVCNTVMRAIAVYERVQATLGERGAQVELLHGRFNARDRFTKERSLLARMETKRREPGQVPVVLVATQVVEVSLDIDFDTIFTEPAPLEALVQRFGRVNRGRRRTASDVHVLREAGPGPDVYEPEYVRGAVEMVATQDGAVLDEAQVGPWLDRVYDGRVAEAWARQVERARVEFRTVCIADLRAFQSDPQLAEAFDRMFDGTEVLPGQLELEYERISHEEPLASSELLVPISSRQLWQLQNAGRVRQARRNDVIVADVPYDSHRGFHLAAAQQTRGLDLKWLGRHDAGP